MGASGTISGPKNFSKCCRWAATHVGPNRSFWLYTTFSVQYVKTITFFLSRIWTTFGIIYIFSLEKNHSFNFCVRKKKKRLKSAGYMELSHETMPFLDWPHSADQSPPVCGASGGTARLTQHIMSEVLKVQALHVDRSSQCFTQASMSVTREELKSLPARSTSGFLQPGQGREQYIPRILTEHFGDHYSKQKRN